MRPSVVVIGLVALTGALPVDAAASSARDPEAWITFQDGERQIQVIHPDGTGQHVLELAGRQPHLAEWSPDGHSIVYVSNELDGTTDIWVATLDGERDERLIDCAGVCVNSQDPSWSPDGSKLVYWMNDTLDVAQWIVIADATSGETISSIPGPHLMGPVNPHWSPDGTMIVVEAGWYEPIGNTYRLASTSLGMIDLTAPTPSIETITPPGVIALYPDWSPDGDRLVFAGVNLTPFQFDGETPQLFTIRPDGTELTQITHRTDDEPWIALPDWTDNPDLPMLVTFIRGRGTHILGAIDLSGEPLELLDNTGAPISGARPRLSPSS